MINLLVKFFLLDWFMILMMYCKLYGNCLVFEIFWVINVLKYFLLNFGFKSNLYSLLKIFLFIIFLFFNFLSSFVSFFFVLKDLKNSLSVNILVWFRCFKL